MTTETKQILISRAKSFLWRLGSFIAVGIVGFVAQNLDLFSLSPQVTVVAGLLLGELTKYLNTQTQTLSD